MAKATVVACARVYWS